MICPMTGVSRWFRPQVLVLLIGLLLSLQLVPVKADADFNSVRVRFDYKDSSGWWGDPDGKYWHESNFHPHYDGRFTNRTLRYHDQRTNLSLLIQSYLFSMADIGAETWIIHGTLLGWWWNRKIMPWDSDIDMQMSLSSLDFLASYYNMTIHTFKRRDYLLEINPHYVDGSVKDRFNVIDGRWIDTQTGLFIDITAIRAKPGGKGVLTSKDKHQEQIGDLFPLRQSTFEGLPVKIPYNYIKLLTEEYGNVALSKVRHRGHHFNSTFMDWERIRAPKAG